MNEKEWRERDVANLELWKRLSKRIRLLDCYMHGMSLKYGSLMGSKARKNLEKARKANGKFKDTCAKRMLKITRFDECTVKDTFHPTNDDDIKNALDVLCNIFGSDMRIGKAGQDLETWVEFGKNTALLRDYQLNVSHFSNNDPGIGKGSIISKTTAKHHRSTIETLIDFKSDCDDALYKANVHPDRKNVLKVFYVSGSKNEDVVDQAHATIHRIFD